ncbi:MAG: zinc ribbon domain-containing protein [Candidatus Marinimicrobia bacterium]|jgi:hypothetical protein|nr:zinc ribbon domain-containing protein [Candidatus Neomarinimicrobiota bacterium]
MIKKILLFLLIPILVFGKNMSRFDAVVFPDYYYQGIMVEIQAVPDSGKSFQAFSLTVPADVDSAFMVNKSGENPISLPVKQMDKFNRIDVPGSSASARIFYFYSPDRTDRLVSFTYDLNISTALDDAHILIQEPMVAEQFKISKSESEKFEDPHGLTFHRFHVSNVKANEAVSFSVSYRNQSGKTTMEVLRNALSADQPDMSGHEPELSENPIQRHILPTWQPLIVLGVFAFAVGILFDRKRKQELRTEENQGCASCGKRIKPEDKYCANCGKEL